MRTYTTLAFAASAAAQYSESLLPSKPGGAVPAGVKAPNTSGFDNTTIQTSRGGLAVCVSGTVSVEASTSQNLKFNFELPQNQSQVTNVFLRLLSNPSPFAQELVGGTQSVNGAYEIGATLCTPANNTTPDQVQLLTHGIGFDRYYWDFAPGYSYVDVAAQYGHATFLYDRLGVGKSTKADPLNVVQAALQVEIANVLAQKLRDGAFSDHAFSTVIGTGHSFGSIITQAVTSQYPKVIDAAILTGYSVDTTAAAPFQLGSNLAIASQNQPYRFGALNNGYLVVGSAIALEIGFFRAPGFDPEILSLAEATKGTATFGEFFSISAVTKPAANWTKPVAVVNGNEDLPFCFGNCSVPVNKAEAVFPVLYPQTKTTGAYLVKDTGHGQNLHYSAVEAYHYIQNFIGKNVH
ncbi:hypothetical protein P171DRAFT_164342 [Karstenula rhodostoma CBS 690.94]|uniref:AB hydrolase-1 domain-containing protein n=1 Tax=Karstenula rhodostoma CBS 690.94 TaxID=1392251 RepID=A0A9P4P767_9PLEO|nr:hypothetical protein P171DRAFT_164342 [Karstenula rhodostoma CBS 690.94]